MNGNAKLYPLRDDPTKYDTYKPAATGKKNPSVYVNNSNIYVAWDDNRFDDPTVTGTGRNRDVFFARMGSASRRHLYLTGPSWQVGCSRWWYVLSWRGVTEHAGDILFQTRFGDNPSTKERHRWRRLDDLDGNPGSPAAVKCNAGADCVYDAPGRHIVDPSGNDWFDSRERIAGPYRYMQYKVILAVRAVARR